MFNARRDIIDFFEKGVFPFKGNVFETKEEKQEKSKKKQTKIGINKFNEHTAKEETDIKEEFFRLSKTNCIVKNFIHYR